MRTYVSILSVGFTIVFGVESALAIPPPDFLFAVGSQVGIVFSVIVVFLSTVLGGSLAIARSFFARIKHKRLFWAIAAIVVLALSVAGGIMIDALWQQREYEQWLQESKRYADDDAATEDILELDISTKSGSIVSSASSESISSVGTADTASSVSAFAGAPSNQAMQRQQPSAAVTDTPQPQAIGVDPNITFIETYYDDLGGGRIEEAYEVSKKSVSLETFRSWYANTTGTEIESIQQIREDVYSLVARIDEGDLSTRYAVLMTLGSDPVRGTVIVDSDVKVLGETVSTTNAAPLPEGATPDVGYFDANKHVPLVIGNDEFSALRASGDLYVLDAREDEEYENGNLPGSHHVRFADLVAGEWIGLPTDRTIYVLCWSGIRGKEVAEFLRSKGFVARFLESGSDGWVSYGGEWNGNIKFVQKYTDPRYQIVFSTKQVREYEQDGVVFVDSRPAATYNKWHIPGSVNIPIIYTATVNMESVLAQVPPSSTVVTVCDDFVSCFDAKITGVKLEKRGHTFLGRYNKPWEYRSTY